jgi:hypothetical protein
MASKRYAVAMEVLQSGGYFRRALERAWQGGEKFKTRLYRADLTVVPGVSGATLNKLRAAGVVVYRSCTPSSTWPEEFVLDPSANSARIEWATAAEVSP